MRQASQESQARNDHPASIADANSHTVRRVFAAWNANDFAALGLLFHPEAVWSTPGRSPVAGEASGSDAALELFVKYARETGGTFRACLRKVLQSQDGRVVAIHHDCAQRKGKSLSAGCCTVFDFEDGLILEGRDHFHDLYSWDDFWS